MLDKLAIKKGSWFEWEQWRKMVSLGSRNLTAKTSYCGRCRWKIIISEDLYLPLSGKTKKLTTMTDEKWNILDRKELGAIRLCLVSSVAFNISKETTTEGLIKALAKLYEKPST